MDIARPNSRSFSVAIPIEVVVPAPELGGPLSLLSLSDALQLLERTRADATVFVSCVSGMCGCIHVRSGQVVDADAGVDDAYAAFFMLMRIERGHVATAGPTRCERRISLPLHRLLLVALGD